MIAWTSYLSLSLSSAIIYLLLWICNCWSLSSDVHRKLVVDVSKCSSDREWTKSFHASVLSHKLGFTRGCFIHSGIGLSSQVAPHVAFLPPPQLWPGMVQWQPTLCERALVATACVPGALLAGPQAPPRQVHGCINMCWNLSHQGPAEHVWPQTASAFLQRSPSNFL